MFVFFQAEDGIRGAQESRGLGDVYKRQVLTGLTERTHGFTFGTPPIRAAHLETSYPAALRAAGYRTGSVSYTHLTLPTIYSV